jgi:hypothetical protein
MLISCTEHPHELYGLPQGGREGGEPGAQAHHLLSRYIHGDPGLELRLIEIADGVSEGQFKQVLDLELPRLKGTSPTSCRDLRAHWLHLAACKALNINPKITVIVVGKRHHVRFFPANPNEADRSLNCVAGTVVDTDIAHPVEFDFYLQSHGGLLGTSRPSHYNVLHDENEFGYVISLRRVFSRLPMILSGPMVFSSSASPCAMYTRARRAPCPFQPRSTVGLPSPRPCTIEPTFPHRRRHRLRSGQAPLRPGRVRRRRPQLQRVG